MSEIKPVESKEIIEFDKEKIDLIKRTLVPQGVSDEEFQMFIHLAKKYQLDPFAKEIYLTAYNTKYGKKVSIFAGRDGFLSIAHRNPNFDGFESGVEKVDEPLYVNGKKVRDWQYKGWCKVYRKDWSHPVTEEVYEEEYTTWQNTWLQKPRTMIQKVAESQALRKAFRIHGLYTREEMDMVIEEQKIESPQQPTSRPKLEQKNSKDLPNPHLVQVLKEKVRILSEMLGVKEEMILHELERRAKKPLGEFTNDERNQAIKYLVKWIEKEEKVRKTEPEVIIEEPYEEDEQLMAEAVKLWQE
ncbi:hypothetical protein LN42_01845 [Marinitoga sp. 1137]|uniref:phage recombination protein Bet n=1 Tax=Marinitoga sp. 1137 TaxID=1545835 RepID=UPI0009504F1D|nr:phage recombination protein Bet [Marinitoga sp. 1137]APT75272.1 hypothetical protein LN42_01845 [Marinitoga sp. 1137]